jgi:hypothetical protein
MAGAYEGLFRGPLIYMLPVEAQNILDAIVGLHEERVMHVT